MSSEPTDLVAKAQQGDEQAFAALVALYERPARRVAWQVLGNRPDADDALQEAWLVAWRRLDSLREPDRFGPWLYRIVANVSLRKRQQRAAAAAKIDVWRHLADDCAADAESREFDAPASDHSQRLPAALEALSAKNRLVVTLHYFSGLAIDRIAGLLDLPAGTVKSRLFYARQTLRKEIEMADQMKRPEFSPADFRKVIHGTQGPMPWEPLLAKGTQGWYVSAVPPTWQPISLDAPPKPWQQVEDGLVGEDPFDGDGSALVAGDAGWADYEVSVLATALGGGNIQLLFRANRSPFQAYVFDMMLGWQTVDIHKLEVGITGKPHLTLLSVVNYPLEHQREYAVSIAARGQSLTTYIDGALVNQVADASIGAGGVGPNVWHGKTLFRDLKIRHMR